MEVNLENILSRDCSSLSRDDLESSSMRRRRPCCGCRGRSRVKAGAGGEQKQRPRRAQPCRFGVRAAAAARGRGGRLGGRWARTRAPRICGGGGGGGSDTVAARLGFLPPVLPAAACRGRRRGPGRPRPGRPCGGAPDATGAGVGPAAAALRGLGAPAPRAPVSARRRPSVLFLWWKCNADCVGQRGHSRLYTVFRGLSSGTDLEACYVSICDKSTPEEQTGAQAIKSQWVKKRPAVSCGCARVRKEEMRSGGKLRPEHLILSGAESFPPVMVWIGGIP
ncbi:uncharacterized protein LOC124985011 [Sciurus carolinensis]|uniref:uncharacterized protein LOC124985011 n=1 Tax=Sciurus carolinensis TaxID=30640 RepID=UPI001FB33E64|nr:uncharacterized protein LOC124985011 [Sciurus carolinensis]